MPEFLPTETITRLIDAQAEAIEIANEEAKVRNNWQLNETASMTITGSAPPDAAAIAADTPVKAPPAPAAKPGDVADTEDDIQSDEKPRDAQDNGE